MLEKCYESVLSYCDWQKYELQFCVLLVYLIQTTCLMYTSTFFRHVYVDVVCHWCQKVFDANYMHDILCFILTLVSCLLSPSISLSFYISFIFLSHSKEAWGSLHLFLYEGEWGMGHKSFLCVCIDSILPMMITKIITDKKGGIAPIYDETNDHFIAFQFHSFPYPSFHILSSHIKYIS